MDAYARYSIKSAYGKFGLHCVKATCLILRDPTKTLLKRESAADQSVCRESAEAIVPPKRTTPVGRVESRRGQPLKSQNL